MNQLQDSLGAIILGLAMVILLGGCGSPPLIQPESDVAAAQTTAATSQPVSTATDESETAASPKSAAPDSPLATPTSVPAAETPTGVLETPASSSNEFEYAAEKISLKPINVGLEVSELSIQQADSEIVFNSWSNGGQQFAFISSPTELIDPDPPGGASNPYIASELWLINIDGTGMRKIAEQMGDISLWSPKDSFIALF